MGQSGGRACPPLEQGPIQCANAENRKPGGLVGHGMASPDLAGAVAGLARIRHRMQAGARLAG